MPTAPARDTAIDAVAEYPILAGGIVGCEDVGWTGSTLSVATLGGVAGGCLRAANRSGGTELAVRRATRPGATVCRSLVAFLCLCIDISIAADPRTDQLDVIGCELDNEPGSGLGREASSGIRHGLLVVDACK